MNNLVQKADWNAASGDGWLQNQEQLDRMLAECGHAILATADARPGERVLDIGCGAGDSSFALARSVAPGGTVTGIDISVPLIGRAHKREAQESTGARFLLADAATHDFTPAQADLLFSRFGLMFFDDPVAALRNLYGGLRNGGRLAFICWRAAGENDWVRLPMQAVRGIVPLAPGSSPDPDAPGPFSFGDPDRVERLLAEAGFRDIRLTPFDCELCFGTGDSREAAIDDAVRLCGEVGPLRRLLAGQPEDICDRAVAAVRAAFARQVREDGVFINGACWIVTARA